MLNYFFYSKTLTHVHLHITSSIYMQQYSNSHYNKTKTLPFSLFFLN